MLLEHKSSPYPGARLQLLRYVVRILTQWYEQNQPKLPLPPVLPLLANQGPDGWKYSCEFADLFGAVPAPLAPYLPSFRHALVDLAQVEDPALSTEVRLRAFLKALKYSRRVDLAGKAQGKAEGEANILTRLLERRFGTVPDSLRQRIFAADVRSIEAWVERAFDAPDLQSIFDAN